MRRALNAQPLNDYDPEIECTFHQKLREQREAARQTMEGQEHEARALHDAYVADLEAQLAAARNQLAIVGQNQVLQGQVQRPQTLAEYMRPAQYGPVSGVVYPEVQARYFELKPSLINMVQQNQFGGLLSENPHQHLTTFLELMDTVKIHDVSNDALRMRVSHSL